MARTLRLRPLVGAAHRGQQQRHSEHLPGVGERRWRLLPGAGPALPGASHSLARLDGRRGPSQGGSAWHQPHRSQLRLALRRDEVRDVAALRLGLGPR